ncbi:MAG: SAM-dependent methyltransferase [Thermodesulfobacteriota bacterium]
MKPKQFSRTAEIVAAWRAAEAMRPADERVCNDYLACRLVSPALQTIVATGFLRTLGHRYSERQAPGMPGLVLTRTRYIDDRLQVCLDEGLEQLVILGAGLDSRAYRFPALAAGVRVFEVDHPATQQEKQNRVRKAMGSLPDHVTYVAVDFDQEKPGRKLYAAGYGNDKKTLFIWEGVVTYLTAAAVDETLAFMAGHSAPGSSLIMSYLHRSVIDGRQAETEETRRFVKAIRKRGEPATFGIDEAEVADFLTRRGFGRVTHDAMPALGRRYFTGARSGQRIFPWAGIARAVVNPL